MNKKVYKTLEYNKILDTLANYAASSDAKKRCLSIKPLTDIDKINYLLETTNDALNRIFKDSRLSFVGVSNINGSLKRIEIGGSLNTIELLKISSLLEVAKRAKSYSRSESNTGDDSLTPLFDSLEPLTNLSDEIKRCIISENEIADDASSTLSSIRKKIRGMNDRIHAQLMTIMNNSTTRSYLQDAVVTMRDGRYCLPVKAEHKSQVPGMVHDQSSTGSTLFIEPMAVVNLNNDLKKLFMAEEEEINVILQKLSEEVLSYSVAIATDYKILVELDFIFAKAHLAKDYNGTKPIFNTNGYINILKGRHPLLDQKKVVPINIHIGSDYNQLIVTGPNTGGKTVSLKTVGLLTLMGQAGLLIPASDRSELAIFKEIYADIGDEQSIEQSLSTFSSHMTNIVEILKHADSESLVLFDELCAGTDPTEGAALAIAILNKLLQYGSTTMATTHYSELKVYALTSDNVENACCEFDVETLSPTYRLLIGIPGKSNAFAISSKLGLNDNIIDDARSRLGQQDEAFEDLLADLETSRKTIENERIAIANYKREIKTLKEQLETKKENIDAKKQKIIRDANEEALRILQEAKTLADTTIRNFHKYGKGVAPMAQMERERTALRQKMTDNEKKLSNIKKKKAVNNNVPKNLHIGDKVKVLSMNIIGTVHTLPNARGDLQVQMGILRSNVNISDLVLVKDESTTFGSKPISSGKKHSSGAGKIKMSKSANVSSEINLIGMTTDEALAVLDKYLDDAYIAHLSSVRIVHGKGTGALRKAVQAYLKRQKYIKSYHLGEFGEGDAGVTIAEFD
ncbi:endonuclease MutS2 [Lachnobacterium bovis]|uniref:endonuclease MutS2 n=1 Tax=Lachnobacterium bovis TaxID=140626 RepID=UPI0003B60A50|nr:endonuclease MutS2 [Lachnobacterium bovis]